MTTGTASHRGTLALAAVAVALGLGLSGCGSGEKTVVTDNGTVTVDQDSGKVEIESSDGSATITGDTGGDLPEGWPDEITLPEGGTITSAVSVTGDDAGWNVAASYPDASQKDLADDVSASMEDAGFEAKGSFTSGEGSVLAFEGNGFAISVIVGSDDSGASLVMTVAKQG